MGITALVMGILPMGYFAVLELVGGLPLTTNPFALIGFVGFSAIIAFAIFLGLCYQAQSSNCKNGNFKTVAANAGIATAIHVGMLMIGLFVPGLHSLVGGYFSQSMAAGPAKDLYSTEVDAGFWGAFGAAYGVAVGVTIAGSC